MQDPEAHKASIAHADSDLFYVAVNKLTNHHKALEASFASISEKLALGEEKGIEQMSQKLKDLNSKIKPMNVMLANLVGLTALYSPVSDEKSKSGKDPRLEKVEKCVHGVMKAGIRPSPTICQKLESLLQDESLKKKFNSQMSTWTAERVDVSDLAVFCWSIFSTSTFYSWYILSYLYNNIIGIEV